uniref:Uncharacterized protein n=1 Tax=Arundo donax TaxID=35708 RepID=A0A0A8YXS3_ARUDO
MWSLMLYVVSVSQRQMVQLFGHTEIYLKFSIIAPCHQVTCMSDNIQPGWIGRIW